MGWLPCGPQELVRSPHALSNQLLTLAPRGWRNNVTFRLSRLLGVLAEYNPLQQFLTFAEAAKTLYRSDPPRSVGAERRRESHKRAHGSISGWSESECRGECSMRPTGWSACCSEASIPISRGTNHPVYRPGPTLCTAGASAPAQDSHFRRRLADLRVLIRSNIRVADDPPRARTFPVRDIAGV
jgi:hypothetical protein